MKKIYILIGALAITSANFAQERFIGKVVASPMGSVQTAVANPLARTAALSVGDTINWSTDASGTTYLSSGEFLPEFASAGSLTRYGYLGGGYIFGNNKDHLDWCAAGFLNLNSTPITIDKVVFSAYAKKQTSSGTASTIKVGLYSVSPNKAWNETSPTNTVAVQNSDGPDVLTSVVYVPIANVDTTSRPNLMGYHFTVATFSTPITFAGSFAVAIDTRTISGTAPGDTIGLLADTEDPANTIDYTFHYYANRWFATDYLFDGLKPNIAIFPVVGLATAVKEFVNGVKLNAIYPNPSKDAATISYSLEKNSANVSLNILDINGKVVFKEVMGDQQAGDYNINLNVSSYAAGSYFYQLHSNGRVLTKEFVVTK